MKYSSGSAFNAALGDVLRQRSQSTGVGLDRLRRRVLVERLLARLVRAEPDRWVLKGGMALEVRLGDRARRTKDVDVGLRESCVEADGLHGRLAEALAETVDEDHFEMVVAGVERLQADRSGFLTWRAAVTTRLAGKHFGRLQLDVSPRVHELGSTEFLAMPGTLDFAGVPAPTVEIVDVNRHVAEKFHAMLKDFGDRENTRVRDLVDVVTLREHGLIEVSRARDAVRDVWAERDRAAPPARLPPLPPSWVDRYPRLIAEHPLGAETLHEATEVAAALWNEMFLDKEA